MRSLGYYYNRAIGERPSNETAFDVPSSGKGHVVSSTGNRHDRSLDHRDDYLYIH